MSIDEKISMSACVSFLPHFYSHPDVMMEAYFKQDASPLFFIVFVILTVYCINNVV